jgi:hypothetical protein
MGKDTLKVGDIVRLNQIGVKIRTGIVNHAEGKVLSIKRPWVKVSWDVGKKCDYCGSGKLIKIWSEHVDFLCLWER